MQIGIDASNIRSGGGLTHLSELLKAARPERHGVERVFVWGGRELLCRLQEHEWLESIHVPALDGPLPMRVLWQQTKLSRLAQRAGCHLLFIPGGTYLGDFSPFVTMSRNMLPFTFSQIKLYGLSRVRLKFLMLRLSQSRTFRKAAGMIFLDDYARRCITAQVGKLDGPSAIIPHGVAGQFRAAPKAQKTLGAYSKSRPFKLLYVSRIEAYKHQWHVAEAVAQLVRKGLPVTLELVGEGRPVYLKRLRRTIERLNAADYIHYRGLVPYAELPSIYARSDAFVFASSCENLPNALLEAMSAGLPIACSNKSPMPNLLGDGGSYFDPEDPEEMAAVLEQLIVSPEVREKYSLSSSDRVQQYTWERCADETFAFLRQVAER